MAGNNVLKQPRVPALQSANGGMLRTEAAEDDRIFPGVGKKGGMLTEPQFRSYWIRNTRISDLKDLLKYSGFQQQEGESKCPYVFAREITDAQGEHRTLSVRLRFGSNNEIAPNTMDHVLTLVIEAIRSDAQRRSSGEKGARG